ncbi:hypothetical protein O0555_20930 [Brevibacillus laterosporus]|uniref:hypothetical protein n=1 Tax=Brevibacillus laterosporus TaxID=1465 RepID=UPI00215C628A|nr:hypothetical protein [Brevibacillus laterosporus]MCR8939767.1 hypothetical protein [Brevibacillus laterosporus]MCZ0842407.1 hypothetical protein [Brevibacillus laterosporus]MCZ0846404.1 hypothetical protein [Brevibacillus laterosporus]MED1666085.1 hypothetical protein [Brevibacillus laterosporus]MED1670304.1 hypothetical protein [Brevibacillus laterosporus]
MLEKWQCHKCEKGWLMIQEDTEDKEIHCPFCGTTGEHIEAVTWQRDEDDYEDEMGCLYPSYNIFDQLGYLISQGVVTSDQAVTYMNSRLQESSSNKNDS